MRTVVGISVLVALVIGACGSEAANPATGDDAGVDLSAELFDPDRVLTFELTLPPASVSALTADPRTYVRGSLRYGDQVVSDIGVHLKGDYTFRPLGQKASFKIKFNEFAPGQDFHGLRHMTLNNAIEDPSFLATRLSYLVFRDAGLAAPRAASAWVKVNGIDYGMYVHVETEDKTWLARWFADDSGNLYEAQGADFEVGNEDQFDLETNETAGDRSDLTALFAAIADPNFRADLAGMLDGAAFVSYCAYEAAVNQWDGYCHTRWSSNNFRVYHDPASGRFKFLPWGMDFTWQPYEGDAIDPFDARGLILRRCLAGAACRAAFRDAVRAAADRIESLDLPAQVDRWGAQLRPMAIADPMTEDAMQSFDDAVATIRRRASARPAELRAAANR